MHTIVLFIEPKEDHYEIPSQIGNLIMNGFAIRENANFEILKNAELENNFGDYLNGELNFEEGKGLKFLYMQN